MIKNIIHIFLSASAILCASWIVPGFTVEYFWPTSVIAAVLFDVLNRFIRPLLKIITFPITIITVGFFGAIINIVIFWILTFVPGITIENFSAATWGLLVVSVVMLIVNMFFD